MCNPRTAGPRAASALIKVSMGMAAETPSAAIDCLHFETSWLEAFEQLMTKESREVKTGAS
jgi:hypothetical protein